MNLQYEYQKYMTNNMDKRESCIHDDVQATSGGEMSVREEELEGKWASLTFLKSYRVVRQPQLHQHLQMYVCRCVRACPWLCTKY